MPNPPGTVVRLGWDGVWHVIRQWPVHCTSNHDKLIYSEVRDQSLVMHTHVIELTDA